MRVRSYVWWSWGRSLLSGKCNAMQPAWRDRQSRDGERPAEGVVDRRGDRRPGGVDATLARAFDAKRIERAWRVLGEQNLDRRHLRRGGHQIVGKGRGE